MINPALKIDEQKTPEIINHEQNEELVDIQVAQSIFDDARKTMAMTVGEAKQYLIESAPEYERFIKEGKIK